MAGAAPTAAPSKIRAGQIWREVDPRVERYIIVHSYASGTLASVLIQTVVKADDGMWWPAPRSRKVWCYAERFNGKRGGYAFVEAPQ